jgi:hypothetical protein
MGLGASAELIWGIPVVSHDEDTGEPTPFWDEENEDWREFEGLEVQTYGHYEDDTQRAILTSPDVPRFQGDCWDPKSVGDRDLDVDSYHDGAVQDFTNRVIELDESLLDNRGWWLVSSFG